MVVALGPGRFYGSALPRPRYYEDVKFNDERVDAPPTVLDPLLDWAREAHWSMGGLSFQRHRLQGRIEGSIKKLRAQAEKAARNKVSSTAKKIEPESGAKRKIDAVIEELKDFEEVMEVEALEVEAAPSTPRPRRRRRLLDIGQNSSGDRDDSVMLKDRARTPEVMSIRPLRRSARKLGDEFDRLAGVSSRGGVSVGLQSNPSPFRHRSRESKAGEASASEPVVVFHRTSPRLRRLVRRSASP
ncbi:microtubule-associated protein [Wolffia australiana]